MKLKGKKAKFITPENLIWTAFLVYKKLLLFRLQLTSAYCC